MASSLTFMFSWPRRFQSWPYQPPGLCALSTRTRILGAACQTVSRSRATPYPRECCGTQPGAMCMCMLLAGRCASAWVAERPGCRPEERMEPGWIIECVHLYPNHHPFNLTSPALATSIHSLSIPLRSTTTLRTRSPVSTEKRAKGAAARSE